MMIEYSIIIVAVCEEDGGGVAAAFLDLPECCSYGKTVEEAVVNTFDAFEEWVEFQSERGVAIPEPSTTPDEIRDKYGVHPVVLRATLDCADSADKKIKLRENALEQALAEIKDGRAGCKITTPAIEDAKRPDTYH